MFKYALDNAVAAYNARCKLFDHLEHVMFSLSEDLKDELGESIVTVTVTHDGESINCAIRANLVGKCRYVILCSCVLDTQENPPSFKINHSLTEGKGYSCDTLDTIETTLANLVSTNTVLGEIVALSRSANGGIIF